MGAEKAALVGAGLPTRNDHIQGHDIQDPHLQCIVDVGSEQRAILPSRSHCCFDLLNSPDTDAKFTGNFANAAITAR